MKKNIYFFLLFLKNLENKRLITGGSTVNNKPEIVLTA